MASLLLCDVMRCSELGSRLRVTVQGAFARFAVWRGMTMFLASFATLLEGTRDCSRRDFCLLCFSCLLLRACKYVVRPAAWRLSGSNWCFLSGGESTANPEISSPTSLHPQLLWSAKYGGTDNFALWCDA